MKNRLKRAYKKIFRKLGLAKIDHLMRLISLKPEGPSQGNVLISYVVEPFLENRREDVFNSHTHHWESFEMAHTFLNLGYSVDVIDYRNNTFRPQKKYDIFLAARTNFQRIAMRLNEDCLKIVHLDTAHWLFNNTANYTRTLDFQKRRGISVRSAKLVEPNWAIEHADCATVLGNIFTIDTYRYAKKKLYRIPISSVCTYPFPDGKNFDSTKKNYLWLGSTDFIHKGLDLVVDAFSEMPDCHLYICGPIEREKMFAKAYHKELYEMPNIHTIGWTDVTGNDFINLTKKCVGVIYPSCSEGGGGSVIQCMQAGLIPVVSYEASVDIGHFGIELPYCTKEEIKKTIKNVAEISDDKLQKMSRDAWQFAREHHTRDNFSTKFQEVIAEIIKTYSG